MTTIDRSQLIDSILQQRRAATGPAARAPAFRPLPAPAALPSAQRALPLGDTTSTRAPASVLEGLAAAQPRLVSETVDTLERGFRRTQVFRQSDGRNFIRHEEVLLTERGLKRSIQQDNPSGSTVRFDENLERQSDGAFRRTVRFTDETGATQTKIEDDCHGIDPFIASGGAYSAPRDTADPFLPVRGTRLDISA